MGVSLNEMLGNEIDVLLHLQVVSVLWFLVYTEDGALIPKNTSLIVARIPLTAQQKKAWW